MKHICKDNNSDIISTHDILYFEIEIPYQIENDNVKENIREVRNIETRKLKWEDFLCLRTEIEMMSS